MTPPRYDDTAATVRTSCASVRAHHLTALRHAIGSMLPAPLTVAGSLPLGSPTIMNCPGDASMLYGLFEPAPTATVGGADYVYTYTAPTGYVLGTRVTPGSRAWAETEAMRPAGLHHVSLNVDAAPEIIFDTPIEKRYERALALLGIDPRMLSQEAGHA